MASIAEKVAQIRQAIFGKDVRENIASGIEAINGEVENTTLRQTNLEDSMNTLADNLNDAESIRVSSENTRVTNEQSRSSAETNRVTEFNTIKSAYEAATHENTAVELTDARHDGVNNIDYNNIGDRLDAHSSSLNDIAYNPKNYGAIGDGINNDLTAVNNTQSNAKGVIYLPEGTYLIDGSLNLTHSLIGCGVDTVILLKNGRINVNADNIEIANLKIHSFMNNPINVYGTDDSNRRKNTKIHDIYVEHDSIVTSNFLSVDMYYTDNTKIYNNTFAKGGLQLVQALDYDIFHNKFDGQFVNDNEMCHVSMHSIGSIEYNTFKNLNLEAIDTFSSGEKCIIANNRIENYYNHAIDIKVVLRDSPYTGGSSDQAEYGYVEKTIVSNNTIINCIPQANGNYYGIQCSWYDERVTKSLDINKTQSYVSITDNIVSDMFTSNPLNLTSVYCSGIIVLGACINVNNNTISNIRMQGLNIWEACGIQVGDNLSSGMYAYGCNFNNNIISAEGSGIQIHDGRNCNFNNNVIKKDEKNNVTPRYGFRITRKLTKSNLIGNNIEVLAVTGAAMTDISTAVTDYVSVCCNTFINGGVSSSSPMNHSKFDNNTLYLGTISLSGLSGSPSLQNKINNNTFICTASNYPIALANQKGFIIIGNTFDTSNYAVLIQDTSSNGMIMGNGSLNQVGASFVRYINVTAENLATITETNNIKYI